ncbi:hypothetical protein BT67DRAFT_289626 [Trichocladium antarcticum]|uniref:Uncharacterized protein n=1 Tax=Trichocladium antarcticum TaxID=1450529 RepID=A0AAN6UL34_9PEZI|nr:hypothetical protein BT67DRAFT_289626 [Trichocladium antarcticum]
MIKTAPANTRAPRCETPANIKRATLLPPSPDMRCHPPMPTQTPSTPYQCASPCRRSKRRDRMPVTYSW